MSNNMPAYIVTFPGLTPLYTSCLLTEEQYALEMEKYCSPYDDQPFYVEPYTEERYKELLSDYIESGGHEDRAFFEALFGGDDFPEIHANWCKTIKESLEIA